MAKICGFEVKAVKEFKDHDGYPICQGNVYYKGKKLGFWSQDAWGGADRFEFDTTPYDDALAETDLSGHKEFAECYRYGLDVSLDILLGELLNLHDIEKEYKKLQKKGYSKMLSCDHGMTRVYVGLRDGEEDKKDKFAGIVAKQQGWRPVDVEVSLYGSDSFVIGEPLSI